MSTKTQIGKIVACSLKSELVNNILLWHNKKILETQSEIKYALPLYGYAESKEN